jgi:steroid 5-alpha reductase family enzyme
MSAVSTALSSAALAIVVLMLCTWVLSVIVKNASIVDITWGLGFVLVAWVVRLRVDGLGLRQNLLVGMTSIWGLRLAGYLASRNIGKGEDYRYVAMRRHYGARFPIISLATVFGLQGVLMFIVSLPVQLGQTRHDPSVGVLAWVGIAIWAVGLFFEGIGDLQLAAFKKNPANQGTVMNTGLWKYTRHPNYFGDSCVWTGIALVAAETTVGRWGLVGPVLMTYLLVRVSGKALLERGLRKRKPGYDEYVARTSGFFPMPPKKAATPKP